MPRWMPPEQRFWAKVRRHEGGCWEWGGCLSDTGYGTFYAGRVYSTHRYSWELHFGPIPTGMCVLHRCDNRACVRPDHLWLGTKAENSRDMVAKGRERVPALRGSAHGEAKLTEDPLLQKHWRIQAKEILLQIIADPVGQALLGKRVNDRLQQLTIDEPKL